MAGRRQPTDLVVMKGAKHLTKAEEAARRRREITAPVPKNAKPPKWLPERLRAEFRQLGKKLIALRIYSDLDADALGRYLVAQHQYLMATGEAENALKAKDVEASDAWGRIQERYAKQARNHAGDLGLTVTARCRLVIPEVPPTPETNPFMRLIEGGA